MSLGDPPRFGAWELGPELGRGGFATVYRARGTGSGQEVALKVLRTGEDGARPEDLRRFRREVEAARALEHPGIIKILDASPEGADAPWVAMELVDGEPLSALIGREQLPWKRAVEIARDVADALAAAHAKGILHRDVKPSNILLDREGKPHLTDFGLAKTIATGSKLTKTGEALGTPAYMSPEQARGEISTLKPATDVWSLGCVLYEMTAGRPPFEGETTAAVVGRVLLQEPARLRRVRGDVPEPVERVVRVCLAKPVGERYREAGALHDDLDRILHDESPRVRGPGALRRRAFAGATILALALCAASLAWRTAAPRDAVGSPPHQTPSKVEALAARARALRQSAPHEAARLLGEALDAEPNRHDWQLERGLLLWAIGNGTAAREEWGKVPESSAEGLTARLYRGLEAFFRWERAELRGDLAQSDLTEVAQAAGGETILAKAALAAHDRHWAVSRELLRGRAGWEAALLRAYVDGTDDLGDRASAAREYE